MTPPQNKTVKLVVFDVEGVLIPKNLFLFENSKALKFSQLMRVLLFGFLYSIHAISLKSALKHIFIGLRGVKTDRLTQTIKKLPVMHNAKDVFHQLKAQGTKTALISSGIPDALVKHLATQLGADYGFGFEILMDNGRLTGEICGYVIERDGKLQVLTQLLKTEKISPSECAVIADDHNNSSLFLPEILKVGYNPDFIITFKADKVVRGNLSKILPAVNKQPLPRALPSRNDILRETIHGSGVLVPVLCSIIGIFATALLITSVAAVYTVSELMRIDGKNLPLVSTVTRHAASQTELYEFTAAPLYFAIGILLTILFFQAPASSAAIAIFALGDSAASIFGSLIPAKPLPLNKGKTWGGSIAGFLFAFLAGTFFVPPVFALAGAAVAIVVEWVPLPVNDNVIMPLCTAATLTLLL